MNPPFAENNEQIWNGTFDTGRTIYLKYKIIINNFQLLFIIAMLFSCIVIRKKK
jgi:hypothetical protein